MTPLRRLFDQLVSITDSILGQHLSAHERGEWPEAETLGVTLDNTVEWHLCGRQVFARHFDELNEVELLAVITDVDPRTDVAAIELALTDLLPETLEVDSAHTDYGPALMIAFTCDASADYSDEELKSEIRELFDVVDSVVAQRL